MRSRTALFALLAWAAVSTAGTAHAQNGMQVEATLSSNVLYRGESFSLSIRIEGQRMVDIDIPQLDEIPGARLLNRVPSRSTNYQIINGRTSSSITYTYSFMASEVGEFTLPPIQVSVGGEMVRTAPVSYRILAPGEANRGGESRAELMLRIEVDDERPFVGQQIVASINLYFLSGNEISSYQPVQGWRADGFWKEELQNIRQPRAETVLLDGVRYRKATLLRFALFPTRSGTLTIDPYGMMLGVRSRASARDPFGSIFDSFGTNQRWITLESEPVELDVSPLPPSGRGIRSDIVGAFEIDRTVEQSDVLRGEGIEVTTRVSGVGNLPLITKPVYDFGEEFETYTPQETMDLEKSGDQISGQKRFTDIIVPKESGELMIPAADVLWFEPVSGRWRTASLPAVPIRVSEPVTQTQDLSVQRQSLTPLMEGVPTAYRVLPLFAYLAAPGRLILLFGIPLLLVALAGGARAWMRYREEHAGTILRNSAARNALSGIQDLTRRHDALRTTAGKVPQDQLKPLYKDLLTTLITYYGQRKGLKPESLSGTEMVRDLQQWSTDGEKADATVRRTVDLVSRLNRITYSPSLEGADLNADLNTARDVVRELERIFA